MKINKKIVLGSANFGNTYGIKKKKLSYKKINRILKYSKQIGINQIDTAQSYGDSEKYIGKIRKKLKFKIITKIPSLKKKLGKKELEKFLIKSNNSLKGKIEYVLFHDFNDFYRNDFYNVKQVLKFKGIYFKKIGVSVYSPNEFLKCLKFKKLNCIQIPFNILDYRWDEIDLEKIKKKYNGLEIHARSIFLKGVLAKNINLLPNWFKGKFKLSNKINNFEKKHGMDIIKISFMYVYQQKWLDKIIIGFSEQNQIKKIFKISKLKKKIKLEKNDFKFLPKKILMPKYW